MSQTEQIPLTKGFVAVVDVADLPLLDGRKWRALTGKKCKTYAVTRGPGGSHIWMHRLILATPDGMLTDHINGDSLDNRRSNLRAADACQNSTNMGKRRRPDGEPSSSQYKGVMWDKAVGSWRAKISAYNTRYSLGYFADEADAARAYDAKARECFGSFAALNFPGPGEHDWRTR